MGPRPLDFHTHASDLIFLRTAKKIDKNYGIAAMDDGLGLVVQYDLYNRDTFETVVEIYIAVKTSFVIMNLVNQNAQVTLQPQILDGKMPPRIIDTQLIMNRIEHLICTDCPALTYVKEYDSIPNQSVNLFTHTYNSNHTKERTGKVHTKLLNILIEVRYCYIFIKKLYNRYKED